VVRHVPSNEAAGPSLGSYSGHDRSSSHGSWKPNTAKQLLVSVGNQSVMSSKYHFFFIAPEVEELFFEDMGGCCLTRRCQWKLAKD